VALPTSALARTKTVYPGGPASFQQRLAKTTGGGVDNFLINTVTIHVGDTVVWNGKAQSAGFHSIDFPAKGGSDLRLFTLTGKPVSGINDFAGNPFWFNGAPEVGFNPRLFSRIGGTTYNGSRRADSGLPFGPPTDFKLTFTRPGVYKYFCDVHYGMVGYVVVRKKGQPIPSAASDSRILRRQEAAYAHSAKNLDKTKVPRNNVSVGASGAGGLEVFAMFPSTQKVKVGTTIKFSMSKLTRETHTVTFGPVSYLKPLAMSFAAPVPSPAALYPSNPPPRPIALTLSQTSHGNGFANTGALDRDSGTPLPASGQITFTQAGTYHFICLIHPFMHGTVIVTH
jgi:plastocyanin